MSTPSWMVDMSDQPHDPPPPSSTNIFGNLSAASQQPYGFSTHSAPPPPSSTAIYGNLNAVPQQTYSFSSHPTYTTDYSNFNVFVWHPKYQSCQRYFLDHAQHSGTVIGIAAFVNILLPFQRNPPVYSSRPTQFATPEGGAEETTSAHSNGKRPVWPPPRPPEVSLLPYIRRLVVTGMDFPATLHGFFGDEWKGGVGPSHEQERRNYMFAAKSGGWASVQRSYAVSPFETVPFMFPLANPVEAEVAAAERRWSEFMAFEDWMIGPRAPPIREDEEELMDEQNPLDDGN